MASLRNYFHRFNKSSGQLPRGYSWIFVILNRIVSMPWVKIWWKLGMAMLVVLTDYFQ